MKTKSIATAIAFALLTPCVLAANLDDLVLGLTHQWAKVTYQTPVAQQDDGYVALVGATEQVAVDYPGRAEPLVWQAIALSSAAKLEGGLTGLSKVKRARDLLLTAEKIDPYALSGSIYCSLGSLYAKVPAWPIGFGSKSKAEEYLKHALAINPNGIDPNFFYGELLADEGHDAAAAEYLRRALAAPARPGREDSDAGRRHEAQELLDGVLKKHGAPA